MLEGGISLPGSSIQLVVRISHSHGALNLTLLSEVEIGSVMSEGEMPMSKGLA